jgi:GNAT superfamily N-acetyltransferase
MVAESLLQRFDEQMRKPNQPDGCVYVGDGWSAVIRPPADGNVEPLVARMREIDGWVEWKYHSHDLPADLPERLVAAGLEPEDEETLVVAEAASIPPPPADVEMREDVDSFLELAERVFGQSFGSGMLNDAVPVVAYVDGQPVSCGRVDLNPGVEFAGLFGGVTLPEYRGRGLYRATVARRAEIARDAGYRWLYVEALPTSRPILERLGFERLTTTTPYVIPREAR